MIRVLDALTGVKHASGEVKEIKKIYRPVGQQERIFETGKYACCYI